MLNQLRFPISVHLRKPSYDSTSDREDFLRPSNHIGLDRLLKILVFNCSAVFSMSGSESEC